MAVPTICFLFDTIASFQDLSFTTHVMSLDKDPTNCVAVVVVVVVLATAAVVGLKCLTSTVDLLSGLCLSAFKMPDGHRRPLDRKRIFFGCPSKILLLS